jgi:acetyl esterase
MRADEPHPEAQALLQQLEALEVFPLRQHGHSAARDLLRNFGASHEEPAMADVTHRAVPGYESRVGDERDEVPVRVYTPEGEGPFPVVAFFHGGGFVIGDLETHDGLCRHVAAETGCVVVAVDYRLAPEHPFPAALEDAYAATEWVAENPETVDGDGTLAVMGDSAGGNLAAAVTLMARERDGPDVDHQVLVYPAVDPREDRPSWEQNSEGYFLLVEDMEWFAGCYFGSDVHEPNPYAFPLQADSHADLPPATVLTAGFDPLRDEGVAYAEALSADGVPVTHHHYDDMIHGFITMLAPPADLTVAHEAVGRISGDLRAAFR